MGVMANAILDVLRKHKTWLPTYVIANRIGDRGRTRQVRARLERMRRAGLVVADKSVPNEYSWKLKDAATGALIAD